MPRPAPDYDRTLGPAIAKLATMQGDGNADLSSLESEIAALNARDTLRQAGSTWTETFVTTATGTTQDYTAMPRSRWGVQCVETGTVTEWTVRLEGSLDGANWQLLSQHTKTTNLSDGISFSAASPCLYARLRCSTLTLGGGTSVACRAIALA